MEGGGKKRGTGLQDELAVQEAPFAVDGGGGSVLVAGTVGRRRRLVARIDQPPVVKKILARLGLATEALTKPEDPVWRVRGPPEELVPPDVYEAGLPIALDAVDEDPGVPFFDELPAHDWVA